MFVTRFGVSVEKVVATIENPSSHHGMFRPERKNSELLDPARRDTNTPIDSDRTRNAPTMHQSIGAMNIFVSPVESSVREPSRRGF
jgi:hypothetical protein